jgi:hypothetical protein
MVSGVETLRQVEAKYPALLFKQQLTAYVEKIYGMIRDNLKKEISPLLGLCIQVFMVYECLREKTNPWFMSPDNDSHLVGFDSCTWNNQYEFLIRLFCGLLHYSLPI